MNSIFKYLRTKLHVLLFLLLEAFCITVIVKFNYVHSSMVFSGTREVTAVLHEANSSFFNYFGLYSKNQALSNENLELRKKLRSNYVVESTKLNEVTDSVFKQRYKYLPAEVMTNSTGKQNNFITISRGRSSGIEVGDGVFCPEGVVGQIIEVSDNYAIAASVLNTSIWNLVPKISEMNYTRGKVSWNGKDPNFLSLEGFNKYEGLKVGYHIVTSAHTKKFPENIPIGKIESLSTKPTETFYAVKVRSAVNFGRIQTVYVVIDLFKDEIQQLEEKVAKYNKEE